jgi:N-acetyl-anhydromuramyl-L-alanine amidase AmpD
MTNKHLSANCYSKNRISVDGAVIHFISARYTMPDDPFNVDEIIKILKKHKLSYKGLITREGEYIELVPDNFKQYHAGYSIMNDREDCNSFTNGYACLGGTKWEYPDDQILGLGDVLAKDMTANNYNFDWIQGHDTIRNNWRKKYPEKVRRLEIEGNGRKCAEKHDPASHFKWEILNDMLYSVSEANRS